MKNPFFKSLSSIYGILSFFEKNQEVELNTYLTIEKWNFMEH
jgi:hypothetical protein